MIMNRFFKLIAIAATVIAIAGCSTTQEARSTAANALADGARAEVVLLETTDLHTNVLSYDYFRLSEDKTVGFERTAALITDARKQFANLFEVVASSA